jgi:hypothetical protein
MFEPASVESMELSGVGGSVSGAQRIEQKWIGSMAIPLLKVNRVRSKLPTSSDGSDFEAKF